METNQILQGRKGGNKRKHMSVRERLKHTIRVSEEYFEMLGEANMMKMEFEAERNAARFATKWYRRRWIFTTIALIMVVLAVAGVLVLG